MDLNEIPSDHTVPKMLAKSDCECSGVAKRKCREVGEKCLALELEIRRKMMDLEGIRVRVRALEGERGAIEEEVEGLKKKKAVLEGVTVDDDWNMENVEESEVDRLVIENKVLECEKMSALKEVEDWKRKCKELESRLVELEGILNCKGEASVLNATSEAVINGSHVIGSCSRGRTDGGEAQMESKGTPVVETPENQQLHADDSQTGKVQHGSHVKKRLLFQNERSCNRKLAPSTPEGAINIIESDEEDHIPDKCQSKGTPSLTKRVDVDETAGVFEAEDTNLFVATPKRKRGPKVVLSDDECEADEATPTKRAFKIDPTETESEDDDAMPIKRVFNTGNGNSKSDDDDDDDDIPISQLKLKSARGSSQPIARRTRSHSGPHAPRTRSRRRLVKSQPDVEKGKTEETENNSEMGTTENVEDNDLIEDGSDSDADSMRSFIDDDSDIEDAQEDLSGDGTEHSNDSEDDASDSNLDYREIISRLQRRKDPTSKWVLEGDMLSDFGKDPKLCMMAVCALYRQQTADEQRCKESIVQNGRGFSKFDATRGTKLGEFLTDGDPNGNLKKSVKDLQQYDPDGAEACHKLARHYSKQLFQIYKNNEDPFFPPPP